MIHIYIHTDPIIEKTLRDIFITQEGFSIVERVKDCQIIITNDATYTVDKPILLLGVDIFIPTKAPILLKIISAVVKRVSIATPITKGKITLYPAQETIKIEQNTFSLTDKEVKIMHGLLSNDQMTREELLESVWNYDNSVNTHTTQTHIYRLKKKCGSDFIITTPSGAYCLNPKLL